MALALLRQPRRRAGPRRVAAPADPGPAVDVALVLAIDVSGSVSEERILMQRQGYIDALRHPDVVEAVRSGPTGRIALTFVQWSEKRRQDQSVGWRLVHDAESATAFAEAIAAAERPMPGWTSISAAIDFSVRLFGSSGCAAGRKVVDISGDGANNDGRDVTEARDDAVAAGVVINGLPILEVEPELDDYFRQNVIGGPGSFVVVARGITDFSEAVLRKLLVEIAGGAPREPGGRPA